MRINYNSYFTIINRTLASPKVLSLGNKNKLGFILYFTRLFVLLHPWN